MINIEINSRPISEPIKYNAYYKLVLLLAIIQHCTRKPKKAPLSIIHIMFWGLRSDENFKVLYDFANGHRETLTPWSFEPGIDTVLALSFVNKVCDRTVVGGSLEVQITAKGCKILEDISDFHLFADEIEKLKQIGIVGKAQIERANNNWKLI